MSVIIRELDYNDCKNEYCQLLSELSVIDSDSITREDFIEQLVLIKSNPLHKIYVAILDNKLVGSITLLIEPKFIHNISKVGHIEDVVVSRSVRGKGIGTLLVNKAIDVAKEYGCYKVILDCCDNCMSFYCKHEFIRKNNQMARYFID